MDILLRHLLHLCVVDTYNMIHNVTLGKVCITHTCNKSIIRCRPYPPRNPLHVRYACIVLQQYCMALYNNPVQVNTSAYCWCFDCIRITQVTCITRKGVWGVHIHTYVELPRMRGLTCYQQRNACGILNLLALLPFYAVTQHAPTRYTPPHAKGLITYPVYEIYR